MTTTLLFTRKFNKEEYKFFINEPEYEGERGVCGIKITPYVSVETPDNGLGYTDTVLMNGENAYTLHRYLQPWILKRIEKIMKQIQDSYPYTVY
jgi:hypothetical protein